MGITMRWSLGAELLVIRCLRIELLAWCACGSVASVAPLKNPEGEEHVRIQRIAVLLAERRLLIRHVHAPSQARQSRCVFF